MTKRFIIGISLLILFTTFISQKEITIEKFKIKIIQIENNNLLSETDIKKELLSIYNENLVFINLDKVKKILRQNTYIESFQVKKKYPDILIIKIFEKKPIAILQKKKERFYLSEKIELIKFENLHIYKDLPIIFGNEKDFQIFYYNLKKVNFPLESIKKYYFFESNRWDLITQDEKTIKLPSINYIESLKNFLDIKYRNEFKKYKIFDYRIDDQLILK